jgi:hypothetical protein
MLWLFSSFLFFFLYLFSLSSFPFFSTNTPVSSSRAALTGDWHSSRSLHGWQSYQLPWFVACWCDQNTRLRACHW